MFESGFRFLVGGCRLEEAKGEFEEEELEEEETEAGSCLIRSAMASRSLMRCNCSCKSRSF